MSAAVWPVKHAMSVRRVPPCHACTGQAATVITADEGVRGGKVIALKETVDKALEGLDFVQRVFVMARTGSKVPWTSRDIPLEEVSGGGSSRGGLCPGQPGCRTAGNGKGVECVCH